MKVCWANELSWGADVNLPSLFALMRVRATPTGGREHRRLADGSAPAFAPGTGRGGMRPACTGQGGTE